MVGEATKEEAPGDSYQEGESQEEQEEFDQKIQEGILELNLWLNIQREDDSREKKKWKKGSFPHKKKNNEKVDKEKLRG